MGVIGWGMMGPGNTRNFLNQKDCQVVAACDIDKKHLGSAVDTVNKHYKNKDCKDYDDYRKLMARDDIDTVMLALPDNWHALTSIEAANSGKDIYGEKPLARTIAEQQAIVKAVQSKNTIWQTGSWQRSTSNFHKGSQIVRNGLIGKVTHVEVGLPSGHNDFGKTGDKTAITEPPADLDYDMWIGPSAMEPYIEARIHRNWRWNYNIGGGQLLDWIGHHCDIAHWGLGFDNTGPVEVVGTGEIPEKDAVWNTATKYRITATYGDGTIMTISGGHPDIKMGTKWIGTEGWVHVNRGGHFECSNPEWKKKNGIPDELIKTRLFDSPGHHRNFLDCVKSRQPTITPVEVAHHSTIPGHLGLISMLTGRKIKWDPEKEIIQGDGGASELLSRPYRAPWKLN